MSLIVHGDVIEHNYWELVRISCVLFCMRLLNLGVLRSICLETLKYRFLSPTLFRFWF